MIRQTLALATLAAITCTAHAGRPMATEDAAVLDRGECELESFAARATASGEPTARGLSVQAGCGIGWRSQVAAATAQAKAGGATDRSFTLLGKTALNQPAEGGTAFTLAWGAVWLKPDGGSSNHEASYLTGVMTHPLSGSLNLHANLGWQRSHSAHASATNWALGLEKSYANGIDATAEVFGLDRDGPPWVQFGLRWAAIADTLFIDGSWGMQTSSARPRMLTLGLKYAF